MTIGQNPTVADISCTDSFVECVGEDDCGGDVIVGECLRGSESVVGAEPDQRVAKVSAEGAVDLSGDPVGELEVEPGEFVGMDLAQLLMTRRTRS